MSAEPTFSTTVLQSLAVSIADILSDEIDLGPGARIRVGRPFELWLLALGPNARSLDSAASFTGLYHHSIAVAPDRPVAYALTRIESGRAVLQEVTAAEQSAAALDGALRVLRKSLPGNREVRRLIVPSKDIDALWIAADDRVVVARAPEKSPLRPPAVVAGAVFLVAAKHTPAPGGMRVQPPLSQLRDRSFADIVSLRIHGRPNTGFYKADQPPRTLKVEQEHGI